MCDPGIKAGTRVPAYEDGKANDAFVKYPDGEYYTGQVWPGWCHFLTSPIRYPGLVDEAPQALFRIGHRGY